MNGAASPPPGRPARPPTKKQSSTEEVKEGSEPPKPTSHMALRRNPSLPSDMGKKNPPAFPPPAPRPLGASPVSPSADRRIPMPGMGVNPSSSISPVSSPPMKSTGPPPVRPPPRPLPSASLPMIRPKNNIREEIEKNEVERSADTSSLPAKIKLPQLPGGSLSISSSSYFNPPVPSPHLPNRLSSSSESAGSDAGTHSGFSLNKSVDVSSTAVSNLRANRRSNSQNAVEMYKAKKDPNSRVRIPGQPIASCSPVNIPRSTRKKEIDSAEEKKRKEAEAAAADSKKRESLVCVSMSTRTLRMKLHPEAARIHPDYSRNNVKRKLAKRKILSPMIPAISGITFSVPEEEDDQVFDGDDQWQDGMEEMSVNSRAQVTVESAEIEDVSRQSGWYGNV